MLVYILDEKEGNIRIKYICIKRKYSPFLQTGDGGRQRVRAKLEMILNLFVVVNQLHLLALLPTAPHSASQHQKNLTSSGKSRRCFEPKSLLALLFKVLEMRSKRGVQPLFPRQVSKDGI